MSKLLIICFITLFCFSLSFRENSKISHFESQFNSEELAIQKFPKFFQMRQSNISNNSTSNLTNVTLNTTPVSSNKNFNLSSNISANIKNKSKGAIIEVAYCLILLIFSF